LGDNGVWRAESGGGVTDHFNLTNIGLNTHVQIDTHVGTPTIHFTEGSISHLNIQDIGTNNHGQIDNHIANVTTNPHNVREVPIGTEGQTLRNNAGTFEATSDLTVDSAGIVAGTVGDNNVANALSKQMTMTQAQYDAITPDVNTIYYVTP
jgi:hypothetical protein